MADEFAGYLAGLAGHMREHPELSEVHLYGQPRWREMRVMPHQPPSASATAELTSTAAELAAWARSVGVVDLETMPTGEGWSSVYFHAYLAGQRVRAWGKVDDLPAGAVLSVDDLEHFAAHGVLPDRDGS